MQPGLITQNSHLCSPAFPCDNRANQAAALHLRQDSAPDAQKDPFCLGEKGFRCCRLTGFPDHGAPERQACSGKPSDQFSKEH